MTEKTATRGLDGARVREQFSLLSAFVAVRGATNPGPMTWNNLPRRVANHRHRIWDWSDLQILRDRRDRETNR